MDSIAEGGHMLYITTWQSFFMRIKEEGRGHMPEAPLPGSAYDIKKKFLLTHIARTIKVIVKRHSRHKLQNYIM